MAQLPNITSVTIPETITAITSDTFTDCPRLAAITVAQNNPTYASVDGLLYNKALTRILLCPESAEGVVSLPDQTDAVPASALSHCANLTTLLVGRDNAVFSMINGSLYSKDESTLVACPGGIGETLTLPKQTSTIGPDALAGITTLKSIVALGTITTIDPAAFNDQTKQSTTIALPGGEDYEARKQVWQQAGFKNFATPANPGDTQTPDQPGEGTQPTDPSKPASGLSYKLLEDYTLEASWIGELSPASNPTIPTTAQLAGLSYTVSALAPKAFAGTALTTIDIPASITTIGDQAFANCPSLTRIITHTNTIQIAPTALEACTNLEVWCPYNESETHPWTIGVFSANNHIKAYGLPASQQPLTLEVGQSANLFEPGTIQAPEPAEVAHSYEATCLSVSPEGTITAKAPGTTTISTTLELDQTPLAHTTRTISVVAPTTPAPPEQPETPTPTPPNAQPITPRYPPNLATPTQASAPLYSRGGIQPRVAPQSIDVTLPLEPSNISINAVGEQTTTPINITSTTAEPIRATSITTTENIDPATGASKLIADDAQRANTKVTVAKDPRDPATKASMKLSGPDATWNTDPNLFRVNPGTPLPVTFGLDFPTPTALSYNTTAVSLASVAFTFGLLDPVATSLVLTSDNPGDLGAQNPKMGDTLKAKPTDQVLDLNPTYAWYALTNPGDPLASATPIPNATQSTFKLPEAEANYYVGKYICCVAFNGELNKSETWTNRPVYSDVTAPVATNTLEAYSWAELSKVADYLSKLAGKSEEKSDPVYQKFEGFMNYNPDGILPTAPRAPEIGMKKQLSPKPYTRDSLPEVRIVGINHDAVEVDKDGNATKTAGLTFMATHSLPNAYQMNAGNTNTNGWKGSQLYPRMQLGGDIWNTLPIDLTKVIKQVKKLTNNDTIGGMYAGTEVTPPTSDYLWLPSYKELIGNTKYSNWQTVGPWIDYEGSQYEFFTTRVTNNDGANTILDGMDKTQDGETSPRGLSPTFNADYRERSSAPGDPNRFVTCDTYGNPSNTSFANDSLGVVLGFCL